MVFNANLFRKAVPNINPAEKLKIIALEGATAGLVIEVQFNPKELTITKSVPWQRQAASKNASDLFYTNSEPRTMSFELLIDGLTTGASVQDEIDQLQDLTDVDAALKRPPKVRVAWGDGTNGGMPKFDAVIDELVTTYTMVDPAGRPLRATVAIKLREARNLAVKIG